jgi:hypothetical protein
MPGDQMTMMLILGKAATPGDATPAVKLPEPEIDRHDMVVEGADARTASRNSFEFCSHVPLP